MVEGESRPSPDELLSRVKAEEAKKRRGKLEIFLGYAAGVGKTYAMLEAAQERQRQVDVVVAYVDTHGRPETEALLEGLEAVPRKLVPHRGVTLSEMDLDAVLARKPQLALVDELAHTNAPGSRHAKRYEDVDELLEAGIDVYTTLNVQHVESLRDLVAQITDVWVRETVPDSIIENASEIKLIDLPPDELLQRLKDGKVYVPELIASAISEFFRKGNLTALRELTMRTAAERVDDQVRAYMETHAIRGPWPTVERLLVCIGPGPLASRLVRTARRLAHQLGGEWSAVYVETPGTQLSPDAQEQLTSALKMVERMKAKVATIQGDSVAAAIAEYAAENGITKIVVGKSQRPWWRTLPRGPVASQIIRRSQNFDVYVVSGQGEPRRREKRLATRAPRQWLGYLQAIGLVAVATLIGELLGAVFTRSNLIMVFLMMVVVSAIYLGTGPSILAAVLGMLAFDYFFVSPRFTFVTADWQHTFALTTLILVGVIISYLTSRLRLQTEMARRHERQTASLCTLGEDLAVSNNLPAYVQAITARTKETFGRDAVVFLPDARDKGALKPYPETPAIGENELAPAVWAFERQKTVGRGTDTIPGARARYMPLITGRGAVGVLALWLEDATAELTREEERLLEAYADLAAVAIEGILSGKGAP